MGTVRNGARWGLDRVIFPLTHTTQRDVLAFYTQIAPYLLPHLHNHPVTLKRYPDEAGGEFFYEKDAPAFTPDWVETFGVWRRSGESQINYIVLNDVKSLVWAASVGTLEIHPFLAKAPDIDQPTAIVFDLDPGDGADILQCGRVAVLLRDLLLQLQLSSWIKVSGSKGMQLYVPLNCAVTYAETQPFAKTIAEWLCQQNPSLVVSSMARSARRGKVFIDWSQNADFKTTVAVYSLRAKRRHPYVSMPVTWEELRDAMQSNDSGRLFFSPEQSIARLKEIGDLFAPVLTTVQHLPKAFESQLNTRRKPASHRSTSRNEPQRSSQGGRRRCVVTKSGSQALLQLEDVPAVWQIRGPMNGELSPASALELPARDFPEHSDATGTYELIEGNYFKGFMRLYLVGATLAGEWVLEHKGSKSEGRELWALSSRSDERYPAETNAGEHADPSEPHRSLDVVQLESLPAMQPRFVQPMECKLVSQLPASEGWYFELKLDGYRAIAVRSDDRVELMSRHGNDLSSRFPKIADGLRRLLHANCVLDGEIVALGADGRPSFQELQNSASTRLPIVYYVFDVLQLEGRDLMPLPLERRREMLDEIAHQFVEPIRVSLLLQAELSAVIEQVRRFGLEGVVAKRMESRYEEGKRSGAWLKYRTYPRESFVIGGYLPNANNLEALLVGQMREGKLHFVKKVRNGFVPKLRQQVFEKIRDLHTAKCPFVDLPETDKRRGAVDSEQMKRMVWVEPKVRCEVEFAEWTGGGHLRHASFRRLLP